MRRELLEEVGVTGQVASEQLATAMVRMTIPSQQGRLPLVNVVYRVVLHAGSRVKLNPDSEEDRFDWFASADAADGLATKYDSDFCGLIRALP